jgi:glycosyltransferase involved in cell wall biosynthesis
MTQRDGLSAILIAKNASKTISATLASLDFCDAIIVLDSGSQDDTVAIARALGAKVVETDWLGYGIQKQRALSFVETTWALSIDCDEVVSQALKDEILLTLKQPFHNVYRMPRLNHLCRRPVRCAGWYPDYVDRLLRVGEAQFSDSLVHESLDFSCSFGNLRSPLLHYSYDDLDSAIDKLNSYSSLAAMSLKQRGRRVGRLTPPLRMCYRFFHAYVLRGGCFGGLDGFSASLLQAVEVYFKYCKAITDAREPLF